MNERDLRAFEALMREYKCTQVNPGRVSDNWKAKIFERAADGKQNALYDRAKGFLLRLERLTTDIPRVTIKSPCPKGTGFDHSNSRFRNDRGICVHADDLGSVKLVLAAYFGADNTSRVAESVNVDPESFEEAVQRSLSDDVDRRRNRLSTAPRMPKKRTTSITIFERNPDVVAEALYLAQGICQDCNGPAPFLRASTGQPYLEVHHIKPLSDEGEDLVENTTALCPNCHRKRHYG
jgi:hypothetical protein